MQRSEGGHISSHLPHRQRRDLDLTAFEECAAVCLANQMTLVGIFVALLEDKEAMRGNCQHSPLSSPSPSVRTVSTGHTCTPKGGEHGWPLCLCSHISDSMVSTLPQVFLDERVAIIHLHSN